VTELDLPEANDFQLLSTIFSLSAIHHVLLRIVSWCTFVCNATESRPFRWEPMTISSSLLCWIAFSTTSCGSAAASKTP
jgi:hypothetical protein